MLSADFQKCVHIIPNSQLGVFFGDGYRAYLPDDMSGGNCSTDDMIQDFIEYRKYVEYVATYGDEEDGEDVADKEGEIELGTPEFFNLFKEKINKLLRDHCPHLLYRISSGFKRRSLNACSR